MKMSASITFAVCTGLLSIVSASGYEISISPANYVEVAAGHDITLTATLTGVASPSYKWTRSVFCGKVYGDFDHSGDAEVGTDSRTYTLTNPQESDSRYYWVDVKDSNWFSFDPDGYKYATTYIDVVALPNPSIVLVHANDKVCALGTSGHSMRGDGGGKNSITKWTVDAGTTDVGDPISPAYCDIDTSKVGTFTYKFTGSNIAGTRTATQVITVVSKPTITKQPSDKLIQVGTTGTLSVSAVANCASYNWYFNDLKGDYHDYCLNDGVSNIGTNTYTINAVNTNSSGYYHIVIKNVAGSVTSSPCLVVVGDYPQPTITQEPAGTNMAAGGTLNLSVSATGSGLEYQWRKGSTSLSGATSSTYSLSNVKTTDSGDYSVIVSNPSGSITSAVATVIIMNPPSITKNLTDKALPVGTNYTLSITANNPGGGYFWFSSIDGVTSSLNSSTNSYTLSGVQRSDSGSYWVVVSNAAASVTSKVAQITVVTPPSFSPNLSCADGVVSGISNLVSKGSTLHLNVGPQGDSLSYFWYLDSKLISTSATNSLVVTATNSGKYSLTLTNAMGKKTSSNVVVTVIGPPTITTQPKTQQILLGQNLRLSVAAAGTKPFTNLAYQWYFGSSALSGSTNASLTLTNAGSNAAGSYNVVITNFGGSVTSATAIITTKSDTIPPTLNVTVPAKELTNSTYTLAGTTTDNVFVSNVVCIINNTTNPATSLTNNYAKWSANLSNLPMGTNKVVVVAQDVNGNSVCKTNSLIYAPIFGATLTYGGDGAGVITGWTNKMQYGKVYTLNAKPNSLNLFANWSGISGITTTNSTNSTILKFTVTNNVSLTVNFATNSFYYVAGTYYGLINGPTHNQSGFLTVSVTTNLDYSGKVLIAGQTFVVSGRASTNGYATIGIGDGGDMSFTLNPNQKNLTGSVGYDTNGQTSVTADLAVFSKSNPATNFAGTYTFVLPATETNGCSYGVVTVSTNGTVTATGAAGDATPFTLSSTVSKDGVCPFFAPLYSTTKSNYNGELFGQMTFGTNGFNTKLGPSGQFTWIKTSYTNSGIYADGIFNRDAIASSPFKAPTKASPSPLPGFTFGTLWLLGGNLTEDIGSWMFINKSGVACVDDTSIKTTLDKAGVVKTKFTHNATGKSITASGVVLQNQTNAFGNFAGTNCSGSMMMNSHPMSDLTEP